MTATIHSYCVATRVGPRPRRLYHLLVDSNEGPSLCGVGVVRSIGEPGQVTWDDDWHACDRCMELAPTDVAEELDLEGIPVDGVLGRTPGVGTPLLQWGQFVGHSGRTLDFKIECDALTDVDWECAAAMIAALVLPFSRVVGIPRGGLRLADALAAHVTPECNRLLIVDDMLTTGGSMDVQRASEPMGGWAVGAVLFARGPCPEWITPVFHLHPHLH